MPHNDDQRLFTRRSWLGASFGAVVVGGLVPRMTHALELERLDPMGPLAGYADLAPALYSLDGCRQLVESLWGAYERSGDPRFGEWALVYGFTWWRQAPDRPMRVKTSRIAQRLAAVLAERHPGRVAGHQWLAIHLGTEMLSVGVLDALNAVPGLRKSLERAMAIEPGYFYALPTLILAKLYSKLPPFPISIGDGDRSLQLLDRIRDKAADSFAIWHLFRAEVMYLKAGVESAIEALRRIDGVRPQDIATAYLLDTTRVDAATLRSRLVSGDYNRYIWDPLLEVARRA